LRSAVVGRGAALDLKSSPIRIPAVSVRSATALACMGLVTSLAASASAAPLERFDRLGISFEYPSTWFVTTDRLSNGWDPDYRFVASTMPVKRTRDDKGPCLPGIGRQLRRSGALVLLREARSPSRRHLARLPALPRRLQLRSDGIMCGLWRPAVGAWVPFRDGNRAFVLGVHLGSRAAKGTERELRRLVASLEIRPR
jgi:hypothetical protein